MERFELHARRLNATIRSGWLANDVHLTRWRAQGRSVITYDHGLPPALRNLGVALMLAVIMKDWPCERLGYRFAKPGAPRELVRGARQDRRDFRAVRRIAADILVTDAMKIEVIGESIYNLCWRHQLPRDIVELAFGIVPFDRDVMASERSIWTAWESGT